jgi:hypothetical protein
LEIESDLEVDFDEDFWTDMVLGFTDFGGDLVGAVDRDAETVGFFLEESPATVTVVPVVFLSRGETQTARSDCQSSFELSHPNQ